MAWSDECQGEIDRLLSCESPREVLAVAITNLIEAKIERALCNCGIGGQPPYDPQQSVDFNERLIIAVLDRFVLTNRD